MKKLILFTALVLACLAHSSRAGIVVVGNLARHATIQPGEAFEGVILLKNTDARPAEARVFQTDYLCDAEGRNDYAAPGTTPRSNASWITVTPTLVKVGAGETVSVRYKGRAPADLKLCGTYWSLIMVEPLAPPVATPADKEMEIAVGLQTLIRFGVQIVTEIGREGTRSLQILNKCLVKADNKRFFHLDIGNNGERLLIPAVGVELFDGNGASLGRFDGGRTRIYPTCSSRSKIDLSDVPVGKYTAMVLLDSGGDQVMGAQYELAIEP
jgi:hypothetical protein